MTVIFSTDGSGYWTKKHKDVRITDMRLSPYTNVEDSAGRLRVFFDTRTFDVWKDGLIYTDDLFLMDLRGFLDEQDLAADDIDYSEQGVQGDNYVSLDIGKRFINSWKAKFGDTK